MAGKRHRSFAHARKQRARHPTPFALRRAAAHLEDACRPRDDGRAVPGSRRSPSFRRPVRLPGAGPARRDRPTRCVSSCWSRAISVPPLCVAAGRRPRARRRPSGKHRRESSFRSPRKVHCAPGLEFIRSQGRKIVVLAAADDGPPQSRRPQLRQPFGRPPTPTTSSRSWNRWRRWSPSPWTTGSTTTRRSAISASFGRSAITCGSCSTSTTCSSRISTIAALLEGDLRSRAACHHARSHQRRAVRSRSPSSCGSSGSTTRRAASRRSDVALPLDRSVAGVTFQRGAAGVFRRSDLEELGSDGAPLMKAPDVESVCCVPLVTRNGKFGALYVGSADADAFSEEDVTLLGQTSAQIAIAVENARAYERADPSQRAADRREAVPRARAAAGVRRDRRQEPGAAQGAEGGQDGRAHRQHGAAPR